MIDFARLVLFMASIVGAVLMFLIFGAAALQGKILEAAGCFIIVIVLVVIALAVSGALDKLPSLQLVSEPENPDTEAE